MFVIFSRFTYTFGQIEDDKYRDDCTRVHSGRESTVRRSNRARLNSQNDFDYFHVRAHGWDVFLGGKNSDKNFVARRAAILCGERSFRDVPARDLTRNIVYFRTIIRLKTHYGQRGKNACRPDAGRDFRVWTPNRIPVTTVSRISGV